MGQEGELRRALGNGDGIISWRENLKSFHKMNNRRSQMTFLLFLIFIICLFCWKIDLGTKRNEVEYDLYLDFKGLSCEERVYLALFCSSEKPKVETTYT